MKNLRDKIDTDEEDVIWELVRGELSRLVTDEVYSKCYLQVDDQLEDLHKHIPCLICEKFI